MYNLPLHAIPPDRCAFHRHLDEVATHAAHVIAQMREQKVATFEPSREAEARKSI